MRTKKKPKYHKLYATNDHKQMVITTKEDRELTQTTLYLITSDNYINKRAFHHNKK